MEVRPDDARTPSGRGSSLRTGAATATRPPLRSAKRNTLSALPLATWEEAHKPQDDPNREGGEREARHRPTAEQGSKGRPGRTTLRNPQRRFLSSRSEGV